MNLLGSTINKFFGGKNRRNIPLNYNVNFVNNPSVNHTGQVKRLRSAHCDGVLSVISVSPELSLSGSIDKSIVLYNFEIGDIQETWRGHEKNVTKVVYNFEHNLVISGSRDQKILIWQHHNSKPIKSLCEHTLTVTGLAVCPNDGTRLCSGSRDNSMRLWDMEGGDCIAVQTLSRNLVTDLKWAPCSSYVAQTSEDKELRLWDPRTLELIVALPKQRQIHTCCDISGDSRYCVTGSNGFAGNGCELTLWDVRQRQIVHEYHGHEESIEACAFLPTTDKIASASHDKTIRIWNMEAPECIGSLLLEEVGSMTALAFPTNVSLLVSTLKNGIQQINLITSNQQMILKRIKQF